MERYAHLHEHANSMPKNRENVTSVHPKTPDGDWRLSEPETMSFPSSLAESPHAWNESVLVILALYSMITEPPPLMIIGS